MIRPLIWKEWHEQRWKLAFGTVMLASFTWSLLAARLTTDREVVVVIWILGTLILSLYSAMGVFAPERAAKTAAFLSSKPVGSRKVFFCKWFFGWLNFAVPLLVCCLGLVVSFLVQPQGRYFDIGFIARGTFGAICVGTMIYSMTCCLAPRKSGEALTGFVGLMVLLAMFIHVFLTETIVPIRLYPIEEPGILEEVASFINPIFWMHFIEPIPGCSSRLSILFVEQTILLLLCLWLGIRKWQRSS